jgi:FixJ family two-component response regulator
VSAVVALDDDEQLLDALKDLIEGELGRRCLTLTSFHDLARRRAEVLACELAIIDINLGPEQPSGLDAYGWLNAERFAGRIVFLTGHARVHPLVARACVLGGASVLQKPIDLEELRALLPVPR